ncbi:MAG: hypothetical protein QOI38_2381 [Sphingomonadales bacterium]|jgi:hypothetical protein|nr:hypothetical protein [Sphingomonadales bacterium]
MRIAVAALLALAAPLAAQPAPQAAPSPEAIAAALELLPTERIEQQLLAGTLQMTEAVIEEEAEAMRRRGEEMPPELLARLRSLLLQENRATAEAMLPTFRTEAAMLYARYFSVEELRELHRLQQHPVMRRMEEVGPELMTELMRIGLRAAADRHPELQRRIAETVAEWEAEQAAAQRRPET